MNIERGKSLFASCETITLWYSQEQPTVYAGQKSPLKLRCKNYSPMNGDGLYPLFDEYDDMIALSIEYTRKEGNKTITYFDTTQRMNTYVGAQRMGLPLKNFVKQ